MKKEPRKFIYTIITAATCIIINITLSIVCERFHLPLYLNSIGVIFASAAGGILTGVFTGFLTCALASFANNLAIYYSVILVTIALFTSLFTKSLYFRSIKKTILFTIFIIIYDTLSVTFLSWFLYEKDISIGSFSQLALLLNDSILEGHPFYSLLLSVFATSLVDKTICIFSCFILLNFLPKKFMNIFPYGYLFMINRRDSIRRRDYYLDLYKANQKGVKYPLRKKIVTISIMISVLIGTIGGAIGVVEFARKNLDYYNLYADNSMDAAMRLFDINHINDYVNCNSYDELPPFFQDDQELLTNFTNDLDLAKDVYIVKYSDEGFVVILNSKKNDLDCDFGSLVHYNKDELKKIDDIKNGKNLSYTITKKHGMNLITNYMPIYNGNEFLGYIIVDFSMENFMQSNYVFSVKIISLLFALSIMISCLIYEGSRLIMIEPVIQMAELSNDYTINTDLNEFIEKLNGIRIYTHDEVLELYDSIKHLTLMIRNYTGDLENKNKYIEKFSENLIEILAVMSESRDTSTGEHIRRTSLFVKAICLKLRNNPKYKDILTDEYINVLYKASPLHDIGKIQISDVILNKPGKLTSDEFEIMKTHTVKGKEILERALVGIESNEFLNEAIILSMYHHEWWNGLGYPYGIKGEDIPIEARIMAVADVFDALISKRIYKEAYSFSDALEIMNEENGKHFDPDVFKAFIEAIDTIKEIAYHDLNSVEEK